MEMPLFSKIVGDLRLPRQGPEGRLFEFGEPLLHPLLPEMVRDRQHGGVTNHVECATNGILLAEKLNLELVDASLSQVNISVSSITEERYREVSGVKVDLARFTATLGTCSAQGRPAHLRQARGRRLPVRNRRAGVLPALRRLLRRHLHRACLAHLARHGRQRGQEAALGTYGQPLTYKDIYLFIFTRMVINPDGVVVACCVDWKRHYVIGDLTQDSAADVWNGPALRDCGSGICGASAKTSSCAGAARLS